MSDTVSREEFLTLLKKVTKLTTSLKELKEKVHLWEEEEANEEENPEEGDDAPAEEDDGYCWLCCEDERDLKESCPKCGNWYCPCDDIHPYTKKFCKKCHQTNPSESEKGAGSA